ncbi:MAG: L-rhamnose/proton symporter RhaT [Bacteroidales bacterium]|nr:L-rhamnose/proton symporter RhaT [Bacteroidales bacterium]
MALLGVILIAIGGFASGSFYLPLKMIKKWKWETSWIVNGIFAWLLVPWLVAWITVPSLLNVVGSAPSSSILLACFFGLLWGIGGLTFGLALRYLGMALGMALALGLTTAFSTLIPPLFHGTFNTLLTTNSGLVALGGVFVSLAGIAVCGWAGVRKDKELSTEQKKEGVQEFNFNKGLLVALFAGIMSACFAFGEDAGKPIAESAIQYGADTLWQYNPVYAIILIGGFITNVVWCLILNFKNKSFGDYTSKAAPLKRNYIFAAIAGATWFAQFVFKGMGTSYMGDFAFASWSILFAFVIVFSNMWGLLTKEWKGVSKQTIIILLFGMLILIISGIMSGWANFIQ